MEDLLRGHHQHPVPQDFLLALAGLYRFTFGGKTTMVLKSESALQKSVETLREEGSPGSPTGQCFPLVLPRLAGSTLLSQLEARTEDPPGVCRASSSRGLSPGPVDSRLLPASSHSHLRASCCSNPLLRGITGLGSTRCPTSLYLRHLFHGPVSSTATFGIRAAACRLGRRSKSVQNSL